MTSVSDHNFPLRNQAVHFSQGMKSRFFSNHLTAFKPKIYMNLYVWIKRMKCAFYPNIYFFIPNKQISTTSWGMFPCMKLRSFSQEVSQVKI